jgi:uncharacterized membrane protein
MRYASIDVLRTAAIALMVLVHFMENLGGALWKPAGFGAPLFAFLVGVSFRIWAQSQEKKGRAEADITRVGVRRGLFLFGLGLVFNFFVWLPADLFDWDVLTMIGTALVVLALARQLPSGLLVLGCWMIFVLAPFLRLEADYDSYWVDRYPDLDKTLPDILIGYLCTGYFPLFPWLLFPISGYVAGKVVFPDPADRVESEAPPSVRPLLVIGWCLVAASALLRIVRPYLPAPLTTIVKGWTMFPASPEYVTGVLGMALLLFGGLHVRLDRQQGLARFPGFLGMTRTMSQFSLSMYLLHHVLHIWPLWVYGSLYGAYTTEFWRQAMPTEWAVALTPVCLVVCYFLFRWMARRNLPSVESLMRWICD